MFPAGCLSRNRAGQVELGVLKGRVRNHSDVEAFEERAGCSVRPDGKSSVVPGWLRQ